ncbi:unnamed protein product [Prorocentrum cordatum]|uniref:Kinesin-like protein n=1 Tax=Prorocentrum cordatum TaxID=2364126 RepID=A0ABN9R5T4_9DINO|nr:unnamed protein product [Polarella glacialis]
MVKTTESRESEVKAIIRPGTHVTILAVGVDNTRAKVHAKGSAAATGVDGWISLLSRHGDRTLGPIEAHRKDVEIEFEPKYLKIKGVLTAAATGDLQGMKKIYDGGFMSSYKPDVNVTDARGKSALMFASACGHRDIVEYLLSHKKRVDVNAADNTNKTALHHASTRAKRSPKTAQTGIIRLLLSHNCSLEARDHNGCTPLMFAVANGAEDIAQMLLETKANVNVADFEGLTPMDYATNFDNESLKKLLTNAGGKQSKKALEAASKAAAEKENGPPTGPSGDSAEAAAPQPVPAGMVEAIEAHEEAREVTVAAEDEGEADEEEQDPKAVALGKLQALLDGAAPKSELEAAVKLAKAAGVDDSANEMKAAERRLEDLEARIKAAGKLSKAVAAKDVAKIEKALAEAEKCQRASADSSRIEEARKVLEVEKPRQKARDRLSAAEEAGDAEALKAALSKGEKVGLPTEELDKFRELLNATQSKEKAEEMLKSAAKDKDVKKLKFAIQQAKEAGVEKDVIKEAKAVLKEELPKAEARELIKDALDKGTVEALEEAVIAAKEAPLPKDEYREANTLLKREKEKAKLLKSVKEALHDAKKADMADIDSMREAKEKLATAITGALAAGVAESDLKDAESRRKKLHNTIEDLKGSIRVFCRVRPLSKKEKEAGDTKVTKGVDSMNLSIESESAGSTKYTFDAVFLPGTQVEVFEDCKDLVQSAVDGYNVTLFAYGQTGAGKTFTMHGTKEEEGVAPRTIQELYRVMEEGKSRCNFTVMCSMLELYRNDLVDLLSKGNPAASKGKLVVKTDKAGAVMVENLTEETCETADELSRLLQRGNDQRTVAATEMNSESSRSHLVLIIKVVSVNRETKEQLQGKILLVDLAGSERLKRSGVEGDAQQEAIEINKSLTALGDVIEGLTKNQKVIAYRNHKLTQLMQDSLGGTAKTLMFVNCSPASSNLDETVMSLKYATRAKTITNTSGAKASKAGADGKDKKAGIKL